MFTKSTGNLFIRLRFVSLVSSVFLDFLAIFNVIGKKNGLEIQGVSVFWLR